MEIKGRFEAYQHAGQWRVQFGVLDEWRTIITFPDVPESDAQAKVLAYDLNHALNFVGKK